MTGLALCARADVLVGWDFERHTYSEEMIASTFQAPHMLPGELRSRGKLALIERDLGGVFRRVNIARSPQSSISEEAFFDLVLRAEEGYAFDLESMDLLISNFNTGKGQPSYFVRSSLDGFAEDVVRPTPLPSVDDVRVPLTQIALGGYQNLSEVTFRFYAYDDTGEATFYHTYIGFGNLYFDRQNDIIIKGKVARIPEPALASGLFSLLALAACHRVRRP